MPRPTAPTLRILDEPAITPVLDAAIRSALVRCFPADAAAFSQSRAWHDSAPSFTLLLESATEILAHVGIVDRTITVAGRPLRIAGIQNMFVLPEFRRQGLADLLVRHAMDEARRRGFDAGLLFCLPSLVPLYSRAGWTLLPARRILVSTPACGKLLLETNNVLMFHPLLCSSFPPGDIDLNGNDW